MPITEATLIIDAKQVIGTDCQNMDVEIVSNIPAGDDQVAHFPDGTRVLGGKWQRPGGGAHSFPLPHTDQAGINPTGLQFNVLIRAKVGGGLIPFESGWFSVPVGTTTLYLHEIAPTAMVPPSYVSTLLTTITAAGSAALAPTLAAKDAAIVAKDQAVAAKAEMEAILVTDLATTDGQSAALINTDTSATRSALNSAIASTSAPLFAELVQPLRFPGFASLRAALDAGESAAIQVLSDSTGNENWEWPFLIGQALGAQYPGHRVEWRYWTDAGQDIAASNRETIQNPGARYMNMIAGRYPRTLPNSYAPHIAGTIDVRVTVNMADWTPGNSFGAEILVGESGGTGSWSWSFGVGSTGALRMYYSADGTTLGSIQSLGGGAAVGIGDGTTATIRCVFTPDDGAGNRVAKFYKANGSLWTQIGATVTVAGAVTLRDSITGGAGRYALGNPGAATNSSAVYIYGVEIRDGENGPDITPRIPDVWASYGVGETHPMVGPPALTIIAGAHPGATIDYLSDPTRLKRLTPDYGQVVTILSCSHNQTRNVGRAWYRQFAAWVEQVREEVGTPIVAVTQNPQMGAAVYKLEHARRRSELLGFAKGLNVDVIDTYATFLAHAGWEVDYMADDVHPKSAGQQAWADTIMAAIDATA